MEYLQCFKDIFNNQSVGAFIGAFSAFALVVLNDRRREGKKVKNLRGEIEINLAHAKQKLETARRNHQLMVSENQYIPAPILPFNTTLIHQLTAEVLDRLTMPERRAIDALCYTMDAIDEIFDGIYRMGRFVDPQEDMKGTKTADQIKIDYLDVIVNLKRLKEMCEYYLRKEYGVILTKQYDRKQYEE